MASAAIGVGGALGVQFLLIMLKSFRHDTSVENQLLLFTISVVAGFGARRLLPMISGKLEEQVLEAKREAHEASRRVDEVAEETLRISRVSSALRPDAPDSEVAWCIAALERELKAAEGRATSPDERTQTIWLGRLYRKRGDLSAAIQALDLFLKRKKNLNELDRDYADVLYNKACYLSLKGDLASALEAIRESVELADSNKSDARGDRDFEPLKKDQATSSLFERIVA